MYADETGYLDETPDILNKLKFYDSLWQQRKDLKAFTIERDLDPNAISVLTLLINEKTKEYMTVSSIEDIIFDESIHRININELKQLIHKLKKDKYKLVLICSAILICLRNVLFAIPMPLIALAIIASLRGIAWGSMLAVHLNYFSSIVKKEYLTKSIFALNIFLQIFNALFNQFGPKISSYSYSLMFSLLALFSIIGLIMLIFVKQSNLDTNCDKLITEQNNLEE